VVVVGQGIDQTRRESTKIKLDGCRREKIASGDGGEIDQTRRKSMRIKLASCRR